MKILIFGPKEPLGGVETIVLAYAKHLIKNGAECDFLLYENFPILEAKIADIGGKVIHAASRRKNYTQYKKDVKNETKKEERKSGRQDVLDAAKKDKDYNLTTAKETVNTVEYTTKADKTEEKDEEQK